MKKLFNFVLALSAVFMLTSCASKIEYTTLNTLIKQGSCPEAKQFMDASKTKYRSKDKLLYHMDYGMAMSMCGDHEESNDHFHKAEKIHSDLYTKSLTSEAASLVANDSMRAYAGEDYEKAMVNLFSAINYAALDKFDESLVELRRLDTLLSEINSKYKNKSMYKEDAFARHISGLIYENEKKYDDAFIDLNKAFDQYGYYSANYNTPVPQTLYKDLARLAKKTKRTKEIAKKMRGKNVKSSSPKNSGKVVIIHMSGVAPVKVSDKLIASTMNNATAVAFPRFVRQTPTCNDYAYNIKGNPTAKTIHGELAENISAIAIKNLADRKVRRLARTVVKSVVKNVVKNRAKKELEKRLPFGLGKLASFAMDAADVALTKADTRSWRTLPNAIYLTSTDLKAGEYTIEYGGCSLPQSKKVTVEKGKTKFIVFQSK